MRLRFGITALMGLVLFVAVGLVALRSGSNDWFTLVYTLTFIALIYAAIAARYRGPFWHGFAVAGWGYFVVGFGPWIGSPPGAESLRAVNRNLVTSVILEVVSGTLSVPDPTPPGSPSQAMMIGDNRRANRDGIGHSALTIVVAFVGGGVSRAVASRARGAGAPGSPRTPR